MLEWPTTQPTAWLFYLADCLPWQPNIDAGVIETQLNQLTTPLQIFVGPTSARLAYFGLAPQAVGLYQFNLVVPSVLAGDLIPLTFNLGNVPGTQTLYTTVGQ
jgi:uncharacterized protein (TIGR03437 family)